MNGYNSCSVAVNGVNPWNFLPGKLRPFLKSSQTYLFVIYACACALILLSSCTHAGKQINEATNNEHNSGRRY